MKFPSLARLFRPTVVRDSTSAAWCPAGVAVGGWVNPSSGLGVAGLDPTAQLAYQGGRLPSARTVDLLYTFDWLAQRVIEKMPSIALVRGFRGPEDDILRDWQKLNVTERFPQGAFKRALYDGRGYGGSVLWLGYKSGHPATPLRDAQRTSGVAFMDVFRQHELEIMQRYDDPASPDFGMPELYRVIGGTGVAPLHPRFGQIFHASRAIRFSGQPLRIPNNGLETFDTTGSHAQPELGVSVLTPVLNILGQYGLAWSAVSNMLQDASVGWMKMAGLVEALASEDKQIVEDRMRVLQMTKGTHRLIHLDADNNEEYGRTEVSLTDIPAVLQQFMVAVAGAADVPASIFFSTTPQGLNANSKNEGDTGALYNTCADYQRDVIGPKLNVILTAVAGGAEQHVEWPSLWESSENEMAQTRLARANATKLYWDLGAIEASDVVRAEQTGVDPETIGTPDDDRLALDPQPPTTSPPQGAPGKQQASKIATKQRAAGK